MAAFLIVDVRVKDPSALQQYLARANPSVARHGGRFLVQGGAVEVVEGGWAPQTLVVAQFPSMAAARDWYGSAEYSEALAFRDAALDRNMVLAAGVAPE